jgi:hypothetical protein
MKLGSENDETTAPNLFCQSWGGGWGLAEKTGAAKMLGGGRHAATGVTGVLHAGDFSCTHLDGRCAADLAVLLFCLRITEVAGVVCGGATVLTRIGHHNSPARETGHISRFKEMNKPVGNTAGIPLLLILTSLPAHRIKRGGVLPYQGKRQEGDCQYQVLLKSYRTRTHLSLRVPALAISI